MLAGCWGDERRPMTAMITTSAASAAAATQARPTPGRRSGDAVLLTIGGG